MTTATDRNIKLYHYSFSPYARKITWYLALRKIPYAEVRQPAIEPRPDKEAIGVAYRRIPIMTIGKDVHCDTRIILRKLEQLFPEGRIGGRTPDEMALQKLLEVWHVEAGLFGRAAATMPSNLPIVKDPKFAKDREQFSGRPWSSEALDKNRPENLAYVQGAFSFLETTLLADGRQWVSRTEQPRLVDIEAVWLLHWLQTLPGALPPDLISKQTFPKVFAYIARFDKAMQTARLAAPRPTVLDGATAAKQIFASGFAEEEGSVQPGEPLKLQKGDHVEVFPTDTGFSHQDKGTLLSLNQEEIVIGLKNGLRLHTPRAGFRVRSVKSKL